MAKTLLTSGMLTTLHYGSTGATFTAPLPLGVLASMFFDSVSPRDIAKRFLHYEVGIFTRYDPL